MNPVLKKIKSLAARLRKWIHKGFERLWQWIHKGFDWLWQWIHKSFDWLWQWIHKGFEWLWQSKLIVFIFLLAAAPAVAAFCYAPDDEGRSALWIAIAGGVLAFAMLHQTMRRADAAEKSIGQTEKSLAQKTLSDAIPLLAHERDSVILSSVYFLLDVAKENSNYRNRVFSVLCAHIKTTTTADEYRKKYAKTPSTAIQTLLKLLFIDKKYDIFSAEGNTADLAGAYLAGCNLRHARLQGANLEEARLEGANLSNAKLQHANLQEARLIRAELSKAELNDADLRGAQIQQARGWGAILPGAKLQYACLQGADLWNANMNDAPLFCADLRGTQLGLAKLNKALLEGADLRGADLQNAEFQGARLLGTKMQGASMDEATLPHRTQLGGSDLRGVSSSKHRTMKFAERIRSRVDKKTDLSGVNFDEIRPIEKDSLTDPSNHEIPVSLIVLENKGETPAIEGCYTKEEAEQWIEEYREAIEKALRQKK